MAARSEVVRQSDFIHQLVIDRSTLEELGRVEVLWMYPQSHRVLGFISQSGFLGMKKSAFKLDQIDALGANGVLTHSQPEATTAENVRKLESLLQREIWSDAGNKIGRVTDYLFNLQSGVITHYLFVSDGWAGIAGDTYMLPPDKILNLGSKRVLVSESAAHGFELYSEGIQQKLNKARETLQEDYSHAKAELRSLAQQAQEQAKGRFQQLREQAKERAAELSKQAQERAKIINEQLREKTQNLAQEAQERGNTWAASVKEQTRSLSEQLEDVTQTLTVDAETIPDFDDEEHWDIPDSERAAEPDRTPPSSTVAPPLSDHPPDHPPSEKAEPKPSAPDTPDTSNDDDDDDEPWI